MPEHNTKLDAIGEDVKTILKILNGNGEPSKGLIVRVDRLEQSEARRGWMTKSAIGASITAIIVTLVKLLAH